MFYGPEKGLNVVTDGRRGGSTRIHCLELAACTMIGIADSGRVVVVVAVALTFYVTVTLA